MNYKSLECDYLDKLKSLEDDQYPYIYTKDLIFGSDRSDIKTLLLNILYDKHTSLTIPIFISRLLIDKEESLTDYAYVHDIYGSAAIDAIQDLILEIEIVKYSEIISFLELRFNSTMANRPDWLNIVPELKSEDIKYLSDISTWKVIDANFEYESIAKDGTELIAKAEEMLMIDGVSDDDINEDDPYGQGLEGREVEDVINMFIETKEIPKNNLENDKYNIGPEEFFGPLNSYLDRDCSVGLDGCRMLSCTCTGDNWFTGMCQICKKNIIDISYALRYPLEYGSWKGCYCSLSCVEDDANNGNSTFRRLHFYSLEGKIDENKIIDRTSCNHSES